jgi:hypothetical protein
MRRRFTTVNEGCVYTVVLGNRNFQTEVAPLEAANFGFWIIFRYKPHPLVGVTNQKDATHSCCKRWRSLS